MQGSANLVGIAQTRDLFELEFTVWSRGNNCAAANIHLGQGRRIWGVLFDIPDCLIERGGCKDRKSLDEIEGEGFNYRRTAISLARADGTPIRDDALTYLGLTRRVDIKTSLEYVTFMLTGLREHSMPDQYVRYVKERTMANNSDLRGNIATL